MHYMNHQSIYNDRAVMTKQIRWVVCMYTVIDLTLVTLPLRRLPEIFIIVGNWWSTDTLQITLIFDHTSSYCPFVSLHAFSLCRHALLSFLAFLSCFIISLFIYIAACITCYRFFFITANRVRKYFVWILSCLTYFFALTLHNFFSLSLLHDLSFSRLYLIYVPFPQFHCPCAHFVSFFLYLTS